MLKVPAQRIQAEGRADQEPLASNDTAAGRAQNRRIEITLFAAP
jgi:type VI secretion system protein ImpK